MLVPRYWHYLRFPLPRRPVGALRKIEIDTEERELGESKYDFRRLVELAVNAVTSLMTGARLAVVCAIVAVAAIALTTAGLWPLAVLVAGVMAWLVRRWIDLHRGDTLARMEVLESANVDARSDG